MRILFCNFEYPPLGGGGGVINALLAEELAARHDVTVLTSKGPALPPQSIDNGVRVVRVPVFCRRQQAAANLPSMFAYMLAGIARGRALLQATPFDVINTHFVLPSGPVGDALARIGRLPNVLSLHGGDLFDPSKWTSPHRHAPLRLWVRHLLGRADHLVAQSANTIANAHRFYVPALPVTRIPLGIRRPPAGSPGVRSEYGFDDEDLLLATVGRLVPRKAVEQLLELLPGLPARTRLLVLGNGPKERDWRARAAALGVAERVHFFGFVDESEKFRLLRMADVYVSTSQHEGFGLVFLEAMACGLPIVCYDHGGQTDFLESGPTGQVLRLNDRDGFAAALHRLLADPDARARISAHNRERVEAYYIDHCARRYEAIFEQAVHEHRAAARREPATAGHRLVPGPPNR